MFNVTESPKSNRRIIAGLMALSLAIYLRTLAPTVLFADGGEFQFVPWLPGIAHPTGYPFYTLLAWLFSHLLPLGEVAWRLNLFSAVAAALTVGVVYSIAHRLAARLRPGRTAVAHQLSATGAALTFAFSQTFWSQAIIAEVYSLHALFVALLLWLCLRLPVAAEETRHAVTFKEIGPLTFLFGLGLTHHSTTILMLPAIPAFLWLSGRRRVSAVDGVKIALVGIAPGLLYLYLPLIAPHVPYAELRLSASQTLILYRNTLDGFLQHIFAGSFAGEVQPAAVGFDRLLLSLTFLRQQVGWLGGLLGLAGLFSLRRHRAILALTLLSFVGFWGFNLIYFIGDVYVLFIPCWLILSLWMGLGWLSMADAAATIIIRQKQTRLTEGPFIDAAKRLETRLGHLIVTGLTAGLVLLPAGLLITRFAEVDRSGNTIARDAWESILSVDFPADAVLLSNDRNEIMPMWYYRYVEGRRPDLLGLFPLITGEAEHATIGRLLDEAFASGRPVYLIKPMPGLEIKADFTPLPPLPYAQLVKATRPDLTPDFAENLNYADQLTLTGYSSAQTETELVVTLFWQAGDVMPQENYTSYVHLVDANGHGLAQSDHQPGGEFYPSGLWISGETLRDEHRVALPADLPPGEYTLVTGLYFRPQPGVIENLGDSQVLTSIVIGE